ncbi:hypothetical protein [Xanthocytophaga agilis]|uniref:Uncharacterized protein n=1 Tax=Xanthocytophaga agilis TaxID=3048010 RepID=A0AAE3UH82_9BACT|nr:hypothetical protein [Xanthocytophaga agilis]MDJ1504076.1 hypothetical protein [Xanthocytophaga agilis]
MKKTLITLFILMAGIVSTFAADEKFVKAVEAALTQMKTAKSVEDFQAVANKFEMIGKNSAGEWMPNYYAAYCYANMSFMENDSQKKDQYVTKAESLLSELKTDNDETYIMKAYVAMANMSVDGQNRWQTQGKIFEENLQKAEKVNSENPRIYYLRGTSLFYTPEPFGGGAKNACPLFQKAKTKYESFKPTSNIAPAWGKEYNEEMLKKCQ